jgi:hypothetical protein
MVRSFVSLPSLEQLYEEGKCLRDKCPRQSHAVWKAPRNRPDPIFVVGEIEQRTDSQPGPPFVTDVCCSRHLHSIEVGR